MIKHDEGMGYNTSQYVTCCQNGFRFGHFPDKVCHKDASAEIFHPFFFPFDSPNAHKQVRSLIKTFSAPPFFSHRRTSFEFLPIKAQLVPYSASSLPVAATLISEVDLRGYESRRNFICRPSSLTEYNKRYEGTSWRKKIKTFFPPTRCAVTNILN